MKSGVLIYKCRRCGKESKNTHVPDGIIALSCIINNRELPKQWNGFKPNMIEICSCGDGNIGVADLIGFEEE